MRCAPTWVVAAALVLPVAAWALWSSGSVVGFTDATLAGFSVRTDTLVVSAPAGERKPDQMVVSLGGVSEAAAADSQFYSVIKVVVGGLVQDVGEDSLVLRPALGTVGTHVGQTRVLRWIADSLHIETVNPKADTVGQARLEVIPQRLP